MRLSRTCSAMSIDGRLSIVSIRYQPAKSNAGIGCQKRQRTRGHAWTWPVIPEIAIELVLNQTRSPNFYVLETSDHPKLSPTARRVGSGSMTSAEWGSRRDVCSRIGRRLTSARLQVSFLKAAAFAFTCFALVVRRLRETTRIFEWSRPLRRRY